MFFKKRYKFKLQPDDRPVLVHKTCPSCEAVNDKAADRCESCDCLFDYKFGSDVCLNCGYKGKMKSYRAMAYRRQFWPLGLMLLFYLFTPGGKVCKRCNRLIRKEDYSLKVGI